MRIEPARPEDCAAILALQKRCFRGEAERTGDLDIPPLLETEDECRAALASLTMLKGVAEEADAASSPADGRSVPAGVSPGDIIAAGRIRFDGKTGHVGRLVVDPACRGRGLGRAMLRALEAACPAAERFELFTGHASVPAISLYESDGYRIFAAKPASATLALVFMDKPGPAAKEAEAMGAPAGFEPQLPAGILGSASPAGTLNPVVPDAELPVDHAAYRELWKRLPALELRMTRKDGECRHAAGDRFAFATPYSKPAGLCDAMLHVAQLYLWRCALGFPSWNPADKRAYALRCPDSPGTAWELRVAGAE